MAEIIKTYKKGNRILCYIKERDDQTFSVCTGKPSDTSCLSWSYSNYEYACRIAEDLFKELSRNPSSSSRG